MADLRKEARGRDCTVRLPGICNFNPETSILAHIRRGGVAGVGMKPPDLCACIACSACHDAIGDGKHEYDGEILDAVMRTLKIWTEERRVK